MQKQVTLPDGWHEVTLEKWMLLDSVRESGVEGAIKRIAIVSGLPYEDVRRLNSNSIDQMAEALAWMTKTPEPELRRELVIDGKTYDLVTDASKLEVGCFIDIESMVEDGADERLHVILACLYRDRNSPEYKGIDDDLAERMLELPITVVQGASRFFFLLAQAFTRITRTSLAIRERILTS
jgi:hypothetical protein